MTERKVPTMRGDLIAVRTRSAAALLGLAVAMLPTLAACGPVITHAAPPWVVCGQTLSNSAAGPLVTDVTGPKDVSVNGVTAGGNVDLELTRDCAHGVTLTVTPADAATYAAKATAKDGRLAAAALHPKKARFDVTVNRADGSRSVVQVNLQP